MKMSSWMAQKSLVEGEEKSAFKSMLAKEIKRQIVCGLRDTWRGSMQDLEVVEVEEILPCAAVGGESGAGYMAKVKLMTTVCIPIAWQAGRDAVRNARLECVNPEEPLPEEKSTQEQAMLQRKPLKQPPRSPDRLLSDDAELKVTVSDMDKDEDQPSTVLKVTVSDMDKDEDQPSTVPNYERQARIVSNDMLLPVDDFELHNFDEDRSEGKFSEGQVWALYDDRDGMPRYYAQITKVSSIRPFGVSISWLEPKSTWLTSGDYSLTCGEYELRKQHHSQITHVECFSHQVRVAQGPKEGEILVTPSEGEVWALNRGGIPYDYDLSACSSGKYELVRVVDEGDTDLGIVTLVPLVKVAGFRTRFMPVQAPFKMARQNFQWFSHQVPAWELKEGSVELDPASTPTNVYSPKAPLM